MVKEVDCFFRNMEISPVRSTKKAVMVISVNNTHYTNEHKARFVFSDGFVHKVDFSDCLRIQKTLTRNIATILDNKALTSEKLTS